MHFERKYGMVSELFMRLYSSADTSPAYMSESDRLTWILTFNEHVRLNQ